MVAEHDLRQTSTGGLDSGTSLAFSIGQRTLDEAGTQKETEWSNDYATKGFGIFDQVPEFKEPIKALIRWSVGRGYETDAMTRAILENLTGWGEDSFQSIMTNLLITKKTNGDAYAEIIRNDGGTLINLKPLNPINVKTIVNQKGIITRYKVKNLGKGYTIKETSEILHLCNDRIANEIHGTPAWKACKWELEAKREAMEGFRKILDRSTVRVMYVDADDNTTLSTIRTQWKEGIKNRDVVILPGKRGQELEVADYETPAIDPFIRWIEYLDKRIYQSLGIPKAIADTADFTEAASKVGYMTFEPVYVEEQTLLESDLWNQLAIKIKFNKPASLTGTMQEEEQKNTGQVRIQPSETKLTAQRTE
jgi:hypothetical protein